MMLERLLDALRGYKGQEWLVGETRTRRLESYNIRRERDMAREVEITHLHLKLFADFEEDGKKYRGSCSVEVKNGLSTAELKSLIEEGRGAARHARNAFYPLVEPSAPSGGDSAEIDLTSSLAALENEFHALDEREEHDGGGHASYSEFFVSWNRHRILNSRGVDVSFAGGEFSGETAIHRRGSQGGETEVFGSFSSSLSTDTGLARRMLTERAAGLFEMARRKSEARPTPLLDGIDVLLSGECLADFFDCFRARANASMIYRGLSTYKVGERVQGAGTDCDRITVTLDPRLEGSSRTAPFDYDGLPVSPTEFIKDGVLTGIWGDTRFASYLGLVPSGNIDSFRVSGGTAAADDLRRGRHLEIVSLSDFRVDPVTGDFGSEIRLAFYFDGKESVPVTGGSVSGNIAAVRDGMRMSVEEAQHDFFRGPAAVLLRGTTVSGVG